MTSPILILALTLTVSTAFAEDAEEEAIILNQELQFLADSVVPSQLTTLEGSKLPVKNNVPGERPSLERIYFGDEEDSLSSRTAAPKRKTRGP